MNALFGAPNSFLGNFGESFDSCDTNDDLPLAVGVIEDESQVTVMNCGVCEKTYSLGPEVQDLRHFETCPDCCMSTIGDFV